MTFSLVFHLCLVTAVAAQSGCGNTNYYGPSGVISSPNYPGSYSNDLNCYNYIHASTGSSLSLFFTAFTVESGYDYVTISCPGNSSFIECSFTGYSLPPPMSIPWCNQGLVFFHTDSSVIYTGFSLDYYVSEGGCGNTIYYPPNGYVTSANWPDNYGYNLNCSNIIYAIVQSTFYIDIHQFELQNACVDDWLEISCLDNSANGQYRYCGNHSRIQVYLYGCTRVLLWFHSDDTGGNNYQGFNAEYFVYPDSGGTDATAGAPQTTEVPYATVTAVDPVCGSTSYYPPYGVIRSPNYPGFYYNYLYCDYYIYASPGSSLSFVFESFHVDQSDIVTISCPPNSNFPSQDLSGHILPNPVSIPVCSQGRLNFLTDYTNVSSGFSIDYYVNSAGCGNTVHIGSNGFVNSPFWPDFYGYNKNCSNIIWAKEQSTIQLDFQSFNLQDDCNSDWLEISCLDNSNYGPTRYCGNYNSYNLYIHQCSQVLLSFHSDDSDNYQGFNIEYTIYQAGACGELSYYGPSGVINSPNYPLSYPNFLYCDTTIYATTGSSLLLVFNSFNTEESVDIVTVSCPANSSFPAYEISGNYLPSPVSIPDCSQGLVNFHTDSSTVASGFSLTYYANEGGCGNTIYYPSSGYVTSPNWPDNYGYNQNCYNVIYGWGRSTFYLNFQSFILQSCCSCDWLEISCLDNSDYGPNRYCGPFAPTSAYIYNCSQVLLWFHSDGSSNDQGFNMEYTVYTNVDDSKELSNGTLNETENALNNGMLKEAKKAPNTIKPKPAGDVPNIGRPTPAEDVPNNGRPKLPGDVPNNGRQKPAEDVPSNGRPKPAGDVPNNVRPKPAEGVPNNGRPKPAEDVPSNGRPKPAGDVPSNGRPKPAGDVPNNGRPKPAGDVPSNGKPKPAEDVPNNGRPKPAGDVPSNGKPKPAEDVPTNGKPKPAGDVPSNGKPKPAEDVPNNGRPKPAGDVPSNGKPKPAEDVPTNGKPKPAENAPNSVNPKADERRNGK